MASTKLNLLDRVGAGTFRQDLYYRLDVLRPRIPPLRARLKSSGHGPRLVGRIAGDRSCPFDGETIAMLVRHNWPGNVRELYHTLKCAWLVGGGQITAELLANDLCAADEVEDNSALAKRGTDAGRVADSGGFRAAVDFAEKQLLVEALCTSGGNKTAAANSLGMKPSTFRDKLAKHGLVFLESKRPACSGLTASP